MRQEPQDAGLAPGSVITLTWPGSSSQNLILQLEENRAQISQGLESDGLCLGIEVWDFSSCPIRYSLGSS